MSDPKSVAQRLRQVMSDAPDLFLGRTSLSQLRAAEEAIGMRFPDEYRDFLIEFGGGIVGFGLPVFGVSQHPLLGRFGTVVKATARTRNDGFLGAGQWIVISNDGFGNPVGISQDGRVWISDHDAREVWLVAEGFWEFVSELLDERLPRIQRSELPSPQEDA